MTNKEREAGNTSQHDGSVERALEQLRNGKMVIVVDDEDRENEGDLIMAAEHVTPDAINFMTQYGRGLVCLPMQAEDFERLNIPMMVKKNRSHQGTPFGVSIGAANGITTGISAHDRARTIRTAVNEANGPESLVMPGHIFPLRAHPGGVLKRSGHTEATIDLMRLAGLKPAGVVCEIMNPDGTMARRAELNAFAKHHDLPLISILELQRYRVLHEKLIVREATTTLPTKKHGTFDLIAYRSLLDGTEHLALMRAAPSDSATEALPLVRLHSECLTGDILESLRCDCGWQLDEALGRIAKEGGVLVYLRRHEGRGIGLANKIKAYALQDQGYDTVEANHALGFKADERDYFIASQILLDLGINNLRLLTNNPAKVEGLSEFGLDVREALPLEAPATETNIRYLETKRDKMNHRIEVTPK